MNHAFVFWCTGLSGAGKTTVTNAVRARLSESGYRIATFDGDDVRAGRHVMLGFSEEDIKLNNALIVDLCKESRNDHDAIFVPIISPYRDSRRAARAALEPGFFEVWFDAPLYVVHARDTKGLYARAREGLLDNLIGVSPSHPYEPPTAPDCTLRTGSETIEESVARLYSFTLDLLSCR